MKRLVARFRRRPPDPIVADLVYELRDDLMVILGSAERLAYLIPPGRAEQHLAQVQRAAERAMRVTADILTATRSSSGPGHRPPM